MRHPVDLLPVAPVLCAHWHLSTPSIAQAVLSVLPCTSTITRCARTCLAQHPCHAISLHSTLAVARPEAGSGSRRFLSSPHLTQATPCILQAFDSRAFALGGTNSTRFVPRDTATADTGPPGSRAVSQLRLAWPVLVCCMPDPATSHQAPPRTLCSMSSNFAVHQRTDSF